MPIIYSYVWKYFNFKTFCWVRKKKAYVQFYNVSPLCHNGAINVNAEFHKMGLHGILEAF